jgi:riboflavin synthase
MFTGIVEEIGTLKRIDRRGQAMVLAIGAKTVLKDVQLGDSISVNGVCLTVTTYDGDSFTVDVMPETFRKTNLRLLQPNAKLNLERAMPATGRFGGHIVQGHVDGTGVISSRTTEDNAVVFRIELHETDSIKYMLSGGSITVDGISLTLVDVGTSSFSISIIPHTLQKTVLQGKSPGDTVNIECDILGKYVERLLGLGSGLNSGIVTGSDRKAARGGLTQSFLSENGFI